MAATNGHSPPSTLRIAQLYTYPIKSLRGCTPPSIRVTPLGLDYDRRFMLVRAEDGKNMHVAQFTEMCLFTTELVPVENPRVVRVRYGSRFVFKRPEEEIGSHGDEVLEIELQPETGGLESVEVVMHSSGTRGFDMGGKYNEWFGRRFGYEVKLLYLGESRRKVLGNVTPDFVGSNGEGGVSGKDGTGWLTGAASGLVKSVVGSVWSGGVWADDGYKGVDKGIGFADCAPFLVVSKKSWENVNQRLEGQDSMDISKFRPNIILDGADGEFDEDYWAELVVRGSQGAGIVLTANCGRCNSLNVDYGTGKVGDGPAGSILKKLMKDRRVDTGNKWSPVFGRYGFLAQRAGAEPVEEIRFSVGDEVEVSRRNEEHTKWQWPNLGSSA